jgi:hypothetical protein
MPDAYDISETHDVVTSPVMMGRSASDHSGTLDRATFGGIDIVRGPLLHGISATGTASTATLTVEPPSAQIRIGADSSALGGKDVDYSPLLTLMAVSCAPGGFVLAIVSNLASPEEGALCGVVVAVMLGVLYVYGNLDPIAQWVAEKKCKHLR